MIFAEIYYYVQTTVIILVLLFTALLLLRMLFSYTDPNPFTKLGRFSFKLRKLTEKYVYPAARFLARFGIDTRLAPIMVILITAVLAYFFLQIVGDVLFIANGVTAGIINNNAKILFGFILYALISLFMFFIFMRVISSWFVFAKNTFFGFAVRVTDPVIKPLQRIIPTIGMFDLSALIALIVLGLLQGFVKQFFIYS
jgi:YggT family protein